MATHDIEFFRNRVLDLSKPVKVYRCLNRPGVVYSLQQDGLVIGHATKLTLSGCKFVVNESGRQRVLKEKRKNVHAFIVGKVADQGCFGDDAMSERPFPARISYNPYKAAKFQCANLTQEPFDVTQAEGVVINSHGVTGCYLD